jgi:hypothetical protein
MSHDPKYDVPEHVQRGLEEAPITYGWCTACHSGEVALNKVTGTRDLSHLGESPNYPTGYGCEVCS